MRFAPQGMHFFDIATSKSGPRMVRFVHFDFEMRFAPQRRALFRHLNFQKCSETEVFCTFSLQNLLRVTTACNFLFLISADVSAPAALASLLLDPPEPKHSVSRLSYLFAHLHLLSSDLFSSDFSPLWLCSRLALRTSAFSSVHFVGSLTSKLPSINKIIFMIMYDQSNQKNNDCFRTSTSESSACPYPPYRWHANDSLRAWTWNDYPRNVLTRAQLL